MQGVEIQALVLDGSGGVLPPGAEGGTGTWFRIDPGESDADAAMQHLAPVLVELVAGTRPRRPIVITTEEDEVVVLLDVPREGGAPRAGLHALFGPERAVTASPPGLVPVLDVVDERLRAGKGPKTAGELLVELFAASGERLEAASLDLEDEAMETSERVDREEPLAAGAVGALRARAWTLRRRATGVQHALRQLQSIAPRWCRPFLDLQGAVAMGALQDTIDRLDEALERVESIRQRQEARAADQLNQRVYLLTLISGVALPLSFITGLLGVNLGGIPGREAPAAFAILCGMLAVLALALVALLRRKHWVIRE